jgi:hypothetical protein
VSDLIAFLNARLDEDEALARKAGPWPFSSLDSAASIPGDVPLYVWTFVNRHDPARVLREVEAKRALIAFAFNNAAIIDGEWGDCHEAAEIAAGQCQDYGMSAARDALKPLVAVYSDHPDFDPSWAPEKEH